MSDIAPAAGSSWATLLRATRRSRGLSQEELAVEAEVSRSTIIRQESGEVLPDRETLRKLAYVLGIPLKSAEAVVHAAPEDEPLPPPLPRELARLADLYSDMTEADRRLLLERVGWVNEWAESRVARYGDDPARRRRRAG